MSEREDDDRTGQVWMRLNERPMTRVFLFSWWEELNEFIYLYHRVYDMHENGSWITTEIESLFANNIKKEIWKRVA